MSRSIFDGGIGDVGLGSGVRFLLSRYCPLRPGEVDSSGRNHPKISLYRTPLPSTTDMLLHTISISEFVDDSVIVK